MQAIPQVFCELDRLAHISVEYSSTLFSYKMMTDILFLLKENIMKQIMNRQEEVKLFQTQQGIGLRQIMFQHYHKIHRMVIFYHTDQISHEHNILVQVTQSIDEKHKAMENSINFIGPIMREIQHKAKVLDQQLIQISEKITKLAQKKSLYQKSLVNPDSFYKRSETYPSPSELFTLPAKNLCRYDDEHNENQTPNQHSFSLFSPRRFQFLQTETQFSQVESFLDLKLQEVREFIKIEKELTQRTINKIFEIFDQTMGKGLEKLEKSILQYWVPEQQSVPFQHLTPQVEIPKLQFKHLDDHQVSESSDSMDLSCDQNLEDIMKQPIDFRFVKKRLYGSSKTKSIDEVCSNESKKLIENESEEFGVSPTFKFTCPLIIDSVEDISQFRDYQTQCKKNTSQKQSFPQNQQIFLYDSFCKENINTMNL